MFSTDSALRNRPLPDLAEARRRKEGYASTPIAVQAEPQPLMHAAAFGLRGRNYYAHARNPPYWRAIPGAVDALLLRPEVGARLAEVDHRLAQAGLRLFLLDAWRPAEVQAYFHDQWFPAELRRRHSDWSEARIAEEVRRYWAPPSSSGAPAPHATGAAVDLTLTWEDGEPLFMGSLFDDVTPLAHADRFERRAPGMASFSEEEARANRRLLYWSMQEAGFAGHPDEWWHYSYGDQMWARLTGAPEALFDAIEPEI